MPLHDHFHPPWSVQRPWEGFHGAWATAIAFHLNGGLLPEEYFAMPLLQVGGRVEVDVGTFEEADGGGAAGTAVWVAPAPSLTVPLESAGADTFEVQVLRNFGGPQLRAAIELVSPSNKDRPASRHGFAAKCAGYLRRGVSVIVVDIVTERSADLHSEILRALDRQGETAEEAPARLYAASYRSLLSVDPPRLEVWSRPLAIGEPLPVLPLWLEDDLSVPLPLEESYTATCNSLRMRG
jgi:hypothetical protein